MTHQLGSGQIQDIVEVKIEVAEIKNMEEKLYNRLFIPVPVLTEVDLKYK